MDQQTLPLSGIKVIDFTQVMLGPCATQTLGDFGAEVIKVERKGAGDLSRWAVEKRGNSDNPVFCSLNRNKRSIALDMRGDAGKALARDLIRDADVVVSNFRPGVMERLGLGYEDLSKDNPGLIWAFGSGFGSSGPYQHKGGQDVLAQAMSGVMARKADPDHPLAIYPTTLCDYSAGMHLVQGVLLALLAREKTGRGQKVEVSLYDSILAMQMQEAAMEMAEGIELNWASSRPPTVPWSWSARLRKTPCATSVRRWRSRTCRASTRPWRFSASIVGYCRPFSANALRPTPRHTGSSGLRGRISCARRSRP